ncbi:H(+)/Cl(-) exchange transporter 7 [Nymphon striatum]|nr:H(+)/Cl(-) exchange transporter 7 [Nymphon striatum]
MGNIDRVLIRNRPPASLKDCFKSARNNFFKNYIEAPSSSGHGHREDGDDNFSTNSHFQDSIDEPVAVGDMNLLSQKFESLNYDTIENNVYMDYYRGRGNGAAKGCIIMWNNLLRWLIVLFIGIFTAVIASFIDMSIESVSFLKYSLIKKYMDTCSYENCLIIPYALWVFTNAIPVCLASILVAYVEPVAIGSGIPQIKCYLNGVKIPRVVRIKTLICKAVGVTLSVIGGLAIGKEGPMIHSGAVVAAGLSQGKSTTLKRDFKIFSQFRTDQDKRDFVSAGAAAGVSAAFGAPVVFLFNDFNLYFEFNPECLS